MDSPTAYAPHLWPTSSACAGINPMKVFKSIQVLANRARSAVLIESTAVLNVSEVERSRNGSLNLVRRTSTSVLRR